MLVGGRWMVEKILYSSLGEGGMSLSARRARRISQILGEALTMGVDVGRLVQARLGGSSLRDSRR